MRTNLLGATLAVGLSFLLTPLAALPAAVAAPVAPAAAAPSDCSTFEAVAHRGVWGKGTGADENTIKAYETAAARGYGIEIDVWADSDGALWAFHDKNIARATGEPDRLITSMTTEEVRALRYQRFGSSLVTLDQALSALADNTSTRVYLEPKARPLAAKVAQKVADYDRAPTSYLTDHGAAVRESFPQIKVLQKERELPAQPRQLKRQGVDIVAGFSGLLEPALTARYQRIGIEVQGRNSQSTGAWRRAIQAGADGQLTNLPGDLEAFCPVALKRPVVRSATRANRRTVTIRGRFFTDTLAVRVADRPARFQVTTPRSITATVRLPALRRVTVQVRTPNGATQRTLRLR